MKSEKSRKKAYYEGVMNQIDNGNWSMELRIATLGEIREGIRTELDRLEEGIRLTESEIKAEREKKIWDKELIEKKQELIKGLKKDAENMKGQMMGKPAEREDGKSVGGIDQEVKDIESKIAGALSFKALVNKHLRKL